ncbi:MAG: asparaginase, partial [Chloroflexi bacterium]|nr:asparaginase [Chloroflexota bacterium]
VCGAHLPLDAESRQAMEAQGQAPTPVHNNCSGKHTGILALSLHRGWPTQGYEQPAHPAQQCIRQTVAELGDLTTEEVILGIDGCSVPVHGLPVAAAATAFARLVEPDALPPLRAAACRRIVQAMMAHPEMVAGEGRVCTQLMQTWPGRCIAKAGAEGFYSLGILPGALDGHNPGLGIALKLEDGDHLRARDPILGAALQALGLMGDQAPVGLPTLVRRPLTNHAGLVVGEIAAWPGLRENLTEQIARNRSW